MTIPAPPGEAKRDEEAGKEEEKKSKLALVRRAVLAGCTQGPCVQMCLCQSLSEHLRGSLQGNGFGTEATSDTRCWVEGTGCWLLGAGHGFPAKIF